MLSHGLRDRTEDDTGSGEFFLEGRRDRDAVEYRVEGDLAGLHARENFLFTQRNPELFISAQQLGIDLLERGGPRRRLRRGVVIEALVVDRRMLDPRPARLIHREPTAIGAQPPFGQPVRLVLLGRNEADDLFREPFW